MRCVSARSGNFASTSLYGTSASALKFAEVTGMAATGIRKPSNWTTRRTIWPRWKAGAACTSLTSKLKPKKPSGLSPSIYDRRMHARDVYAARGYAGRGPGGPQPFADALDLMVSGLMGYPG